MTAASDTMSVKDAAEMLGVDKRTVHAWTNSGKLPSFKTAANRRRVERAAVEQLAPGPQPRSDRVETLSIGRFVHGFRVPDGFDLVTSYTDLAEYSRAFSAGAIPFLLLVGSPGSGKSRQLKADLEGRRHAWIDNHVSNLGLYCKIYEADGAPLVLDDVNHLFKHREAASLVKALTQTEAAKMLSWESTTRTLEQRGVPRHFTTGSPVCLTANRWNASDADLAAVQDRSTPVAFFPSAGAIHDRVRELGWCRRDVWAFVGRHLGDIPQPSMRDYHQAMTLRAAGLDWERKLLARWTGRSTG